ncbi:hypothetical protein LLEC1_00120 [Akanthomyces lecanii]|uniref:ABC transmembrane type-1 domain-containing protein n=1 Tax=Cordyceps confragosa TaxID=2714763 RepID=A0A179IKG7_CORDF|nr:hypothetical protein LLEC1_00120 [Akanthomyces lecanii]
MTTPLHRALWAPLSFVGRFSIQHEKLLSDILPSLVLLAFATALLHYYLQNRATCPRIPFVRIKLNVAAMILGIEVATLVGQIASFATHVEKSVAVVSVPALATFSALAVFFAEEHRHIRAPACLTAQITASFLLDMVKCINCFHRGEVYSGSIATVVAAIRLALLAQELLSRWDFFAYISPGELPAGVDFSALWQSFILFLNPVLVVFRSDIDLDELRNPGPQFSSEQPYIELRRHWENSRQSEQNSLFLACLKAWRIWILASMVMRFILMCFSYAEPLVMYHIILTVGRPEKSLQTKIFCVASFIVVYLGKMLSRLGFSQLDHFLHMKVRGGLLSLLYEKSQKLTSPQAQRSTVIPLLTSDVDNIVASIHSAHAFLFALPETALGVYLLYFFMGLPALSILVPILLNTVGARLLGGVTGASLNAWVEEAGCRARTMSRLFPQLPAIRMIGLGPSVAAGIERLRAFEVDTYVRYIRTRIMRSVMCVTTEVSATIFVMGVALKWNSFGNELSPQMVFPSLSLIRTAQTELFLFPMAYSNYRAMLDSLERVRAFLCLEERQDLRNTQSSTAMASLQTRIVIQFVDVAFIAQNSETPKYYHINFGLVRGTVTALLGTSAEEKTGILQSILGETKIVEGHVNINAEKIGFSAGCAWLQEVTIRQNIIGPLPFDGAWFDTVVMCCLLKDDLERLPNGDQYIVSRGGMNLSGGQRHRVAIARAVYSRAPVLLFDDVFSSLDRRTAASILFMLCGQDGILREMNSTVVLSTYMAECLDVADQCLVLDTATKQISLELNSGRQQFAGFLRDQHVSASEVVEERQQKIIRRIMDSNNKVAPDNSEAVVTSHRPTNWRAPSLFVKPIGAVKIMLFYVDLLASFFLVYLTLQHFIGTQLIFADIYMRFWLQQSPNSKEPYVGYALTALSITVIHWFYVTCMCEWLWPIASVSMHKQLLDTTMRATLGFLGMTNASSVLNRYDLKRYYLVWTEPEPVHEGPRPGHCQISKTTHAYSLTHAKLCASIFMTVSNPASFTVGFIEFAHCVIILAGASHMYLMLPLVVFAVAKILHFHLRIFNRLQKVDSANSTPILAMFEDTCRGLEHIRAFGWQATNTEALFRLVDNSQKSFFYKTYMKQWTDQATTIVFGVIGVTVISLALFQETSSSEAAIGLCMWHLWRAAPTIMDMIRSFEALGVSFETLSGDFTFMEQTPKERGGEGMTTLPENWPTRGRVEFTNVTAKYRYEGTLSFEPLFKPFTP